MCARRQMTPVGFEPTQLALVELESTPLDHSGKVSMSNARSRFHRPTSILLIFACSEGGRAPAWSPTPRLRGGSPGAVGGFGPGGRQCRAPPTPNQFQVCRPPLAESTTGIPSKSDWSTRWGRPGKPSLNYDLLRYLGPCCGILICKFEVQVVGGQDCNS